MKPSELSVAETEALDLIKQSNMGVIPVYSIPDNNEKGLFGEVIPGISVYKKLEKKV